MKFEQPVQQIVFQESVDMVNACSTRVQGIDEQLDRVLTIALAKSGTSM